MNRHESFLILKVNIRVKLLTPSSINYINSLKKNHTLQKKKPKKKKKIQDLEAAIFYSHLSRIK